MQAIDTTNMAAVNYASFWRRLGAHLIDSLIIGVPAFFIFLTAGIITAISPGILHAPSFHLASAAVFWLFSLLIPMGYYAGFESSKLQATPGKLALKIKVTDINGQRPSYARALARAWSIHIAMWFMYIGVLMIFWTKKRQGLQDMVANCLVLNNNQQDDAAQAMPSSPSEQAI